MKRGKYAKARAAPRPGAHEARAAFAAEDEMRGLSIAQWKVLFDARKTSIADFLSVWKIRTERTGDQPSKFVRFVLHDWQQELLRRCLAAWKEGRAYKVRIPKSRRLGVSAFWRAFLGFERVLRIPGFEHTITAQSTDDAGEHLQYLREFYLQVPTPVLKALGVKRLRSNASEFAFLHGKFEISRVRVKTSRANGLGRGGQNNGIHMTERPHYTPKAKKDLNTSLLPNCANVAGNVIPDESTAMGFDEFYDDCIAARDGVGDYDLFFLPAMARPLNYRKFKSNRELEKLKALCGTERRYGGVGEEERARVLTEQFWLSERGATPVVAELRSWEFVHWRRYTINDETKHITAHRREHPQTLEEAFSGSGRLVYPPEIIEPWLEAARRNWRDAEPGTVAIHDGRPSFGVREDGMMLVRERPVPDGNYVMGVDVASGHRVIAGSREEADFSTAVVLDAYSGRTVATFRGHVFPRAFADVVVLMSGYYNWAKTFVEVNIDTVVGHILEMDYEIAGVNPADMLLTSERKIRTETGWSKQTRFGWYTSAQTKRWMISVTEQYMREWAEGSVPPVDAVTSAELLRYVYDDRGSANAEAGHDDMVIAWGLALVARQNVLGFGEVPLMSKRKEAPADPFLEQFRQREAQKREMSEPLTYYNPMTGDLVTEKVTRRGGLGWRGF